MDPLRRDAPWINADRLSERCILRGSTSQSGDYDVTDRNDREQRAQDDVADAERALRRENETFERSKANSYLAGYREREARERRDDAEEVRDDAIRERDAGDEPSNEAADDSFGSVNEIPTDEKGE
jgi:hypothetical protein